MRLRTSYIGWRLSGTTVVRGRSPNGTVTLAELANPAHMESVARRLETVMELDARQARLTLSHYAASALCTALVSPLACDGVVLSVVPNQVGLVMDDSGNLVTVWVGAGQEQALEDPAFVGRLMWGTISAVGHAARDGVRVGAMAMNVLMYEAIELETLRWARIGAPGPCENWPEAFLSGLPFKPRTSLRSVTVTADDGPAVELPVRRVCCVLQREPGSDACPNCPQFNEWSRVEATSRWVASLADADFAAVTGRARVVARRDVVEAPYRRRAKT